MKKPHLTPISSNFLRSQNRNVEYIDKNHFIQFDCNSISFKPLTVWVNAAPKNIDLLFQNFQAILRKYNEKHFHKLNLNFYQWIDLDTIALRRLGSEIGKRFRNLQELRFQFFSCSRITESGLQHLISPISQHLKSLRTLSLSVTGSTPVNKKGARYVKTLLLKRVKNLTKLSLNFSGESMFSGEETYPFETDLLTHLKRHDLVDSVDYLQSKGTSKAALQICKSTSYCLRNLQQLVLINSIDFWILILKLISLVFRRVRQLQVLYMAIMDKYLIGNHNKIKEINTYMKKNLSKLRYLTFNFFELDQIRKKNLIPMLGNTLPHLSELRGFTLSVDISEEIHDEDLLSIIDQICLHGKHLENLNLSFETVTKISDQGLEQATYALSQHLIDLKELTLFIPYTIEESNEHAAPLLSFSSLMRLHLYIPTNSFSINLSGCDKHLEELTLSFNQMSGSKLEESFVPLFTLEFKKIRQFNLLFALAGEMQDEDVRMLCSCNWTCMKNLKEFTLGISYTKAITDHSLVFISELIKTQLKSLSTLRLSFRNLRASFTENGIKELSRTIVKNLKQLNDLEFDFPLVTLSEEVMDLIIIEIVNYAKKLKKIRMNFASSIEDRDFIRKMRKKLSFVPVIDFYYV